MKVRKAFQWEVIWWTRVHVKISEMNTCTNQFSDLNTCSLMMSRRRCLTRRNKSIYALGDVHRIHAITPCQCSSARMWNVALNSKRKQNDFNQSGKTRRDLKWFFYTEHMSSKETEKQSHRMSDESHHNGWTVEDSCHSVHCIGTLNAITFNVNQCISTMASFINIAYDSSSSTLLNILRILRPFVLRSDCFLFFGTEVILNVESLSNFFRCFSFNHWRHFGAS